MKSEKNRGFTLVEVLISVAILAILVAVAVASTANYIDMLKLTELDNAAREIYMAAENRSVLLSGIRGAEIDTFQLSPAIVTLDVDPVPAPAPAEKEYGYISRNNAVSSGLLAKGNIDPTLWEGERDFYIVYHMASGSVTDVFYAEESLDGFFGASFESFYNSWKETTHSRTDRLDLRSSKGLLLGYYNGEAADGKDMTPPPLTKPEFTVEIKNGIKLEAVVAVDFSGITDNAVKTAVSDAFKSGALSVKLRPVEGTGEKELDRTAATLDGNPASGYLSYTWVLDSLDGKKFRQNVDESTVTPGDSFQVVAELISPDDSFESVGGYDTNNSLFGKDSDITDARIANLRHLQNLDTATSNVGGDSAPAITATQTEDIIIENSAYTGTYTSFVPINNTNLTSYDGAGKKIQNLKITVSGSGGLFGEISAYSGDTKTLKRIRLVDAAVTGGIMAFNIGALAGVAIGVTISDCSVINTTVKVANTADGNVGALAGMAENVEIKNCRVYWDEDGMENLTLDSDYKIVGDCAGGLVGMVHGNLKIENSLAATLVEGNNAGGLVGETSGSVEITSSYADCYLKGGRAGGLIGDRGRDVTLRNCYAAGFIESGSATAGLYNNAPGDLSAPTAENVYSVMLRVTGDEEEPYAAPAVGLAVDLPAGNNTVYYLGEDETRDPRGLSSEEMIDGTEFFEAMKKAGFAGAPEHTYAYNLLESDEELGEYPYPGLALPHYGDWGGYEKKETPLPVRTVYYEKYKTKEGAIKYGVFGITGLAGDAAIKNGDVIVEDGYAIAFLKENLDDETISKVAAEVEIDGNTYRVEIDDQGFYSWEPLVVYVSVIEAEDYYVIPLPSDASDAKNDAQNPKTVPDNFYEHLKIELYKNVLDGDLIGEGESLFNPHFAKTVVDLEPGAAKTEAADYVGDVKGTTGTKSISVRTLRHMYYLSNYPEYYSDTAGYRFLQELDLDLTDTTSSYRSKLKLPIGGLLVDENGVGTEPFTGTYDGGEHSMNLDGLDIQVPIMTIAGLFDVNTGTIKNLTIKGKISSSSGMFGGIVGANGGTVENCHNAGTIIGENDYVGGIVGLNGDYFGALDIKAGTVIGCSNIGTVDGRQYVGGIVGQVNGGMVQNCTNTGTVGGQWYVGGIVGLNSGDGTVDNCHNNKTVTGITIVGGIVGMNGYADWGGGTVSKCSNTGTVDDGQSGNGYVGGIVGYANLGMVQECNNTGAVTGGMYVGGIVGWNVMFADKDTKDDHHVEECHNAGTVSGSYAVGGIVGESYGTVSSCTNESSLGSDGDNNVGGIAGSNHGLISNCHNGYDVYGGVSPNLITGKGGIGGIAGYSAKDITYCTNVGSVTGTGEGVGGIAGIHNWGGPATATYCNNGYDVDGNPVANTVVKGQNKVGGIVGNNNNCTAESCNNYATVESVDDSDGEYFGGIVGDNFNTGISSKAKVLNCTNAGSVIAPNCDYVGGIAGRSYGNSGHEDYCVVSGCKNGYDIDGKPVQDVVVTGQNKVGGIVGESYRATLGGTKPEEACINAASSVDGKQYVGGIVGHNRDTAITNCHNNGTVRSDYEVKYSPERQPSDLSYVGGIVGQNTGESSAVTGCTNAGDIEVDETAAGIGGIVGVNGGMDASVGGPVTACSNFSSFGGFEYIGGIVGGNMGASIDQCSNSGNLEAVVFGGGIVGMVLGDEDTVVSNCFNEGNVIGTGYVPGGEPAAEHLGGIVGNIMRNQRSDSSGEVKNCANIGSVSGCEELGSIIGNNDDATVSNCYFLTGRRFDPDENILEDQGIGVGDGSDVPGITKPKDETAFYSGEVAWLLQGEEPGEYAALVWGQDLSDEKSYPVLVALSDVENKESLRVYYNNGGYTNEVPEGRARLMTLSVGEGIPVNGRWTVSIDCEDETVAASFARSEDVSAMSDDGSGTAPLYITARKPGAAAAVVSVTYTYTGAGGAEEAIRYTVRQAASEDPASAPEWEVAALPPAPEAPARTDPDPDDPSPENGPES